MNASLAIATVILIITMTASWIATWVSLRYERYLVPFALLVGGGAAGIAFYVAARVAADPWFVYLMVAGYAVAAGALHALLVRTYCSWRIHAA